MKKRILLISVIVVTLVGLLGGCFVYEFFFPPEKPSYRVIFHAYFYNVDPNNHSLQQVDIPMQSLTIGGKEIAQAQLISLSLTPESEVDEMADLYTFSVVQRLGMLEFEEEDVPISNPRITLALGEILTAHFTHPETEEPVEVGLTIAQASRSLSVEMKELTGNNFATRNTFFPNAGETQIFLLFNLEDIPRWETIDETQPVSLARSIHMMSDDVILLYGRVISQQDNLLPGQRWGFSFQDDPLLYLSGFPFRALSYPVTPLDRQHYFMLIPRRRQMPSYPAKLDLFNPEDPISQPATSVTLTVLSDQSRILKDIQADTGE